MSISHKERPQLFVQVFIDFVFYKLISSFTVHHLSSSGLAASGNIVQLGAISEEDDISLLLKEDQIYDLQLEVSHQDQVSPSLSKAKLIKIRRDRELLELEFNFSEFDENLYSLLSWYQKTQVN